MNRLKILLIFLIYIPFGYTQSSKSDSLLLANHAMDIKIQDKIKFLDSVGYEFMLLRVKDSINYGLNECTFMVKKDSCTSMFGFDIDENYSIRYIHIGDIGDVYRHGPCRDKLGNIAADMRKFDNFFINSDTIQVDLDRAPFTFFGKVYENYSIEYFDYDFVATFHSGFLYDTVCSYFYRKCQ